MFGEEKKTHTKKKNTNGLHIVLDIDSTLIDHGYAQHMEQPAGVVCGFNIFFRPHLLSFLNFCFSECETVSIWTAASEGWMQGFIALLPEEMRGKFFFTWHFNRVRMIRNPFGSDVVSLKDLNKMWRSRLAKDAGMQKHNTLIVEDTRENCFKNFGNAIYVDKFCYLKKTDDDKLHHLIGYIRRLAQKSTVRTTEKRGWYVQMLLEDEEEKEEAAADKEEKLNGESKDPDKD